jgi:sarcosine oxidase subunit alpha
MWMIRSQAVVLASGAIERGVAYANNDLPGTMLAGAARAYIGRYGVKPGARAVVFANHDQAYAAALALHDAGVTIAGIVDVRSGDKTGGPLPQRARAAGLPMLDGCVVKRAHAGVCT